MKRVERVGADFLDQHDQGGALARRSRSDCLYCSAVLSAILLTCRSCFWLRTMRAQSQLRTRPAIAVIEGRHANIEGRVGRCPIMACFEMGRRDVESGLHYLWPP